MSTCVIIAALLIAGATLDLPLLRIELRRNAVAAGAGRRRRACRR